MTTAPPPQAVDAPAGTTTDDNGNPRVGGWMATFTGGRFWPLDPHPEDVDPLDIAHALAYICRFGGHTRRFYSVAEHSVHLSLVVSPKHARWALLHDAAEAYIGDMVRPLKHQDQMREYRLAEDQILNSIARRFGIVDRIPDEVHQADNHILLNERAAFLRPSGHAWDQDLEQLAPLPNLTLEGWPPAKAEAYFLHRMVGVGLLGEVPGARA